MAGISEEEIDLADDSSDPRGALIDLLVAFEKANAADEPAELLAKLRAELAPMRVTALKRRAREAGVDAEALAAADDAADVQRAVIELILRNASGAELCAAEARAADQARENGVRWSLVHQYCTLNSTGTKDMLYLSDTKDNTAGEQPPFATRTEGDGDGAARAALGVKAILTPPCIFH